MIFVPHVLSVEEREVHLERDASGDGIDHPASDIVVSREGGGASGITSLGSDAPADGSNVKPFIDDELALEIIQPIEGSCGASTQLCVQVDARPKTFRGVQVDSRPSNPAAKRGPTL
jgi:hypothetical protein